MSELKDCQSDEFKKWLRSVCFQAPPKHCEDLACMAWQEAGRVAKTATDAEVERLREQNAKLLGAVEFARQWDLQATACMNTRDPLSKEVIDRYADYKAAIDAARGK